MDYTFLISMIILLAIPLFNIILYKEKRTMVAMMNDRKLSEEKLSNMDF